MVPFLRLMTMLLKINVASSLATVSFPPIISSITPWFGGAQGGTIVKIFGANFSPNGLWSEIVVFIGNNQCSFDRYHSTDSVIFCTTPICQTSNCLSSETWSGSDYVTVSVYVSTVEGIVSATTTFTYSGGYTPGVLQMSHSAWGKSVAFVDAFTYTSTIDDISITFGGSIAKTFGFSSVVNSTVQVGNSYADLGLDGVLNPTTFSQYSYEKYIYYIPPDDIMAGFYNLTLTLQNDFSNGYASTGTARMYPSHKNSDTYYYFYNFDATLIGTIYSLCLFPAISSVTPSSVSIAVGTLVTITGYGFSPLNPERFTVFVGGILCDIQSSSYNKIVCVTRPGLPLPASQNLVSKTTFHFKSPTLTLKTQRGYGSPGWWVKMWDYNDYVRNRVGNDSYVKKSYGWRESMYFSLYNLYGSSWPATLNFASNSYLYNYFVADIAAVFIAPYTGYYTFHLCVDDVGWLYASRVAVGAKDEVLLAYSPSYCSDGNFWMFSSQISARVNLNGGQRLYLRLRTVRVRSWTCTCYRTPHPVLYSLPL